MLRREEDALAVGGELAIGWKRRYGEELLERAADELVRPHSEPTVPARGVGRFRGAGTPIRRCSAASRSASSARAWQYVGHLGAGRRSRARFFTATAGRIADRRHPRARTASCARSSTSAATAASRSSHGRGQARDAAVPVPRVDVRARRLAARGAAVGRASPASTSELGLCRDHGRHVGPVRVRQHADADARAARGGARHDAGAARRARLDVDALGSAYALGDRARGELEDRLRELPRVLPLPGRASAASQPRRRLAGAYALSTERLALEPARRRRARAAAHGCTLDGEVPRSQFHFLWPNFGVNVFPGRPNLSMRADGAADAGTHVPLPRLLLRRRTSTQAWIDELIAFDDQVGGRGPRRSSRASSAGIRTGLLPDGRLLSESEQLVVHFQRLCAEALAG